jgi:hypothetical protein
MESPGTDIIKLLLQFLFTIHVLGLLEADFRNSISIVPLLSEHTMTEGRTSVIQALLDSMIVQCLYLQRQGFCVSRCFQTNAKGVTNSNAAKHSRRSGLPTANSTSSNRAKYIKLIEGLRHDEVLGVEVVQRLR